MCAYVIDIVTPISVFATSRRWSSSNGEWLHSWQRNIDFPINWQLFSTDLRDRTCIDILFNKFFNYLKELSPYHEPWSARQCACECRIEWRIERDTLMQQYIEWDAYVIDILKLIFLLTRKESEACLYDFNELLIGRIQD